VLLHQFRRGRQEIPNYSPFCLKLETYLRMTKIPYEVDSKRPMSKKGKAPWIEIDGEEVADTHFIQLRLEKKFNLDSDSHLSTEEKAVSRALERMTEEHLFFCVVHSRWSLDVGTLNRMTHLPWIVAHTALRYVRRGFLKSLYTQGIGRHSPEDIMLLAHEDLQVLATFLGDKKFMFGDKMSTLDASVFGLLANGYYATIDQRMVEVIKGYPTLVRYLESVKAEVYPDWDELVGKQSAAK